MGIFLRNWHLKLGAVFLSTVLYTGLVFSGSFTEQTVSGVPIEMVGQPDDWVPLTQLETVEVRYRVAADSAQLVFPESFSATVEFDDYDQAQAGQPQALPVSIRPLLDGITVLSVTPADNGPALILEGDNLPHLRGLPDGMPDISGIPGFPGDLHGFAPLLPAESAEAEAAEATGMPPSPFMPLGPEVDVASVLKPLIDSQFVPTGERPGLKRAVLGDDTLDPDQYEVILVDR